MTRIFAIINQKGGVGKSTTAQALAAGLSLKGYKVLTVDLDPQGNTSFTFKADTEGPAALNVLLEEATAREAIQETAYGDLLPGNNELAGTDLYLLKSGKETGKEHRLKDALAPVKRKYDYIIIDTPPALGILTVNALTACNSVIIPAQADLYSLQGVKELIGNIELVKKYHNKGLKVEGILFTRYSARSAFNNELAELAAQTGIKVFDTKIREAVAIKKAQAALKSIFEYEPRAKVTADYNAFIAELLGKE